MDWIFWMRLLAANLDKQFGELYVLVSRKREMDMVLSSFTCFVGFHYEYECFEIYD